MTVFQLNIDNNDGYSTKSYAINVLFLTFLMKYRSVIKRSHFYLKANKTHDFVRVSWSDFRSNLCTLLNDGFV